MVNASAMKIYLYFDFSVFLRNDVFICHHKTLHNKLINIKSFILLIIWPSTKASKKILALHVLNSNICTV